MLEYSTTANTANKLFFARSTFLELWKTAFFTLEVFLSTEQHEQGSNTVRKLFWTTHYKGTTISSSESTVQVATSAHHRNALCVSSRTQATSSNELHHSLQNLNTALHISSNNQCANEQNPKEHTSLLAYCAACKEKPHFLMTKSGCSLSLHKWYSLRTLHRMGPVTQEKAVEMDSRAKQLCGSY